MSQSTTPSRPHDFEEGEIEDASSRSASPALASLGQKRRRSLEEDHVAGTSRPSKFRKGPMARADTDSKSDANPEPNIAADSETQRDHDMGGNSDFEESDDAKSSPDYEPPEPVLPPVHKADGSGLEDMDDMVPEFSRSAPTSHLAGNDLEDKMSTSNLARPSQEAPPPIDDDAESLYDYSDIPIVSKPKAIPGQDRGSRNKEPQSKASAARNWRDRPSTDGRSRNQNTPARSTRGHGSGTQNVQPASTSRVVPSVPLQDVGGFQDIKRRNCAFQWCPPRDSSESATCVFDFTEEGNLCYAIRARLEIALNKVQSVAVLLDVSKDPRTKLKGKVGAWQETMFSFTIRWPVAKIQDRQTGNVVWPFTRHFQWSTWRAIEASGHTVDLPSAALHEIWNQKVDVKDNFFAFRWVSEGAELIGPFRDQGVEKHIRENPYPPQVQRTIDLMRRASKKEGLVEIYLHRPGDIKQFEEKGLPQLTQQIRIFEQQYKDSHPERGPSPASDSPRALSEKKAD